MASSMRCRITGCDLDACGICKRCGDDSKAKHDWKEADRNKPCFKRSVCERCAAEKESPDHDWESVPSPTGDINLQCTRCALQI